ncbi:hypothetical protein L9F63_006094, partial [Diploptera punctata]
VFFHAVSINLLGVIMTMSNRLLFSLHVQVTPFNITSLHFYQFFLFSLTFILVKCAF